MHAVSSDMQITEHGPSATHCTIIRLMPRWASRFGISRAVLINSARVTVATVASLLLARGFKLQEFYWAPISSCVVLLSSLNPSTIAWQRFAGTALGAALAALIATYFHVSWLIYGAGIFICGILCALLRITSAYRFAVITLSIVLLITRTGPPWSIAAYRFVEVSLGIAVALLIAVMWPAPTT
jgi:uncharacterized membrane protein YgaE (UPF0421/DUF939 family)